MTRDDIDRMAREAGWVLGYPATDAVVVRFAQLVAAAEREACALSVERSAPRLNGTHGICPETAHIGDRVVAHCAAAIRARNA